MSVPSKGATLFAPLKEAVEALPQDVLQQWDRLWMASDRRQGPVHPLIYKHPVTGQFFTLACLEVAQCRIFYASVSENSLLILCY